MSTEKKSEEWKTGGKAAEAKRGDEKTEARTNSLLYDIAPSP
jgi:hypothetical protein